MTHQPARRRVLFIEDELALRISYERYFRSRYTMAFAPTGAEALSQLQKSTFDVVVLDIVTTAYASVEPQLRVLDLPHADYLVKPFDLDDLAAAIDRAG
jgi:DNA-binding response OmpR family regulator